MHRIAKAPKVVPAGLFAQVFVPGKPHIGKNIPKSGRFLKSNFPSAHPLCVIIDLQCYPHDVCD